MLEIGSKNDEAPTEKRASRDPVMWFLIPLKNFSWYIHSRISRGCSFQADAFRGHGFNLLVTAFLRGFQLVLFPQESLPFTPIRSNELTLQKLFLQPFHAIAPIRLSKFLLLEVIGC